MVLRQNFFVMPEHYVICEIRLLAIERGIEALEQKAKARRVDKASRAKMILLPMFSR